MRAVQSGTGTTRTPPTPNGPSISCALELGTPPPSRGDAVEDVVERPRGCRPSVGASA